jgi:DNA polymerase-3 subunit beta
MNADVEIEVDQAGFKRVLDKADFAMASNDVRYYLNGMLIEVEPTLLRAVATDGFRLALYELAIERQPSITKRFNVILPRKSVIELQKLLGDEVTIRISMSGTQFRAQVGDVRFTTKLIDARFPEYNRVIPPPPEHMVRANRSALRAALERAGVLSNEKHRGIRVSVENGGLKVDSTNPTNDEAEEHVDVTYAGNEVKIGFNVNYLIDTLAAMEGEEVLIGLHDERTGCLISCEAMPSAKYVVMPMVV